MLSVKTLVQEFILDCQARNLAPRTIHVKQFIVMLQGKKNNDRLRQRLGQGRFSRTGYRVMKETLSSPKKAVIVL